MFSLDRWHEVLGTLARAPLRSALTAFAVAWGIFMLVFLLGMGAGLQHGAEQQFADDAANSVIISGAQTSKPYQGLPVGRAIFLGNPDYAMMRKVPGIEHLTGRYFPGPGRGAGEVLMKAGSRSQVFDIRSVHPDHLYFEKTTVTAGRYINQRDVDERRKVTCIGIPVAEFLYGTTDVVGQWIDIGGVSFEIVGVFDDLGDPDETRMAYVPITTAQLAWNGNDRINTLVMIVGDKTVAETKVMVDDIKAKLAERLRFDPGDVAALRIRSNLDQYEAFQQIFRVMRWFIAFMGGCTLFAGMVGVSNIMMIVVKERTKEIGVRKALGATPSTIVGTILQESVFLTALAGYVGLVLAVFSLTMFAKVMPANDYFSNPAVDVTLAIEANIILVVAGALAGFFPALAAARVSPVDAMRDA